MTNQEIVRDSLQALADAHEGRITSGMVVEEARKKQSPLHKFFDWNVKSAAEKHWRDTASRMIRSVLIVVKTETTMVETVAYTRDPRAANGTQGMIAVPYLKGDLEMAREALVEEFRRATAVLHRAHRIASALELEGEVEEIIDRLTRLHSRVALDGVREAVVEIAD